MAILVAAIVVAVVALTLIRRPKNAAPEANNDASPPDPWGNGGA
jgi:hypothetical protein